MSPEPSEQLLVLGTSACVLAAVACPLLARVWRWDDTEISLRKVHAGHVPRAGGAAMITAAVLVLAVAASLGFVPAGTDGGAGLGVLAGALICGLTGLVDDIYGVRARYKLLLQIAAATCAVSMGLTWPGLVGFLEFMHVESLAPFLTGLFLVAGVNAINLSDGLDGLAGGLVGIGLLFVVLTTLEQPQIAVFSVVGLGVTLGFLAHNVHPARVFMGDGGSYFLGFLLTGLLLLVVPAQERSPVLLVGIPLSVLALPLFDMVMAVVRRLLRGQPVFAGDSDHVHHRLLTKGLPQGRVVGLLWATHGLFVVLAFLNVCGLGGWWTLLGMILALGACTLALGYHRLLKHLPTFANDAVLGLRDRRRAMQEALTAFEELELGAGDLSGSTRWDAIGPGLLALLVDLGIPGFDLVRSDGTTLRSYGEQTETWGWLTLPVPGNNLRLRMALRCRLPDLQQEQLLLLERAVQTLSGSRVGSRNVTDLREPSEPEFDPLPELPSQRRDVQHVGTSDHPLAEPIESLRK